MLKDMGKEFLGFLIRFSGIEEIVRAVVSGRAAIAVYHDPSPETFARHLAYLSRRYRFIPLDTLVRAIETQDWSGVPRRALVITWDDGHKGNRALLETCKTYGIEPTLYACSQIVDTCRRFWWKGDWPQHVRFAEVPHQEFLELLRAHDGYVPDREYPDRQALTRAEMIEMQPVVHCGSHGRFHAVLTQCGDGPLETEVAQAKDELEQLLGVRVEHFAYPNGSYGPREAACVKRAGYRSARTLDVGWNSLRTDPFRLKVTGIQDDASLNVLSGQIAGIFGSFKNIERRMRRQPSH